MHGWKIFHVRFKPHHLQATEFLPERPDRARIATPFPADALLQEVPVIAHIL